MIIYRSRFLARGEIWYDHEPDGTSRVDWMLYHQRSQPVPGAASRRFNTYAVDLTRSHEQLLANLEHGTAYKIRRARERDKITCAGCDPLDPAVMDKFEEMYNGFVTAKGLCPLDRTRMESIAASGCLDLSVARDTQGTVLVFHANYRDGHRATSLELPSVYRALSDSGARNLVGRANRYLTWDDILRYKEQGLKWFDFGGWYSGTDPGMLNINDFKKGFGGEILREYECEHILTLKGRVVLEVASLLKRLKRAETNTRFAAKRSTAESTGTAAADGSPPGAGVGHQRTEMVK